MALRPFTLLQQSVDPYPGSRLSDRGLSPSGSLLVDDGAANYDVVNGSSPYELVPAQFEGSAALGDASNAYLYGDQAGGGTVNCKSLRKRRELAGSDTWKRCHRARSGRDRMASGPSSDRSATMRSRANAQIFRRASVRAPASRSQLRPAANRGVRLHRGRRSMPAAFPLPTRRSPIRNSRTCTFRRCSTAATMRSVRAPMPRPRPGRTQASISAFALPARYRPLRISAFAPRPDSIPSRDRTTHLYVGADLTQTRADAGVNASGRDYNVTAGVGTFWIDYAGGTTEFRSLQRRRSRSLQFRRNSFRIKDGASISRTAVLSRSRPSSMNMRTLEW